MKQTHLIKTDENLADFQNVVINLDLTKPKLITIEEPKNTRTLQQNKLMWLWYSVIIKHITDTVGQIYSSEGLHELLKEMFIQPVVFEFKDKVIRKYSTKKLTTKEFTEYLEKVDMYCADRLNLMLPHPEDIFNEAMGRK